MSLMSGVERRWWVSESLHPPFAHLLFIEGPVPHGLNVAMARAAEAHPRVRGRQIGWLGTSRWIEGPAPKAYNGTLGNTLEDAPCQGVDVLRTKRGPVFRCRLALMDAPALRHYVEDVYRVLRGEVPLGTRLTPLVLDDVGILEPPVSAVAATGVHRGEVTSVWSSRRLPARPHTLGRVMAGVCDAAPAGPVCLHIPVDLRQPGARGGGNLTGMVFVGGGFEPTILEESVEEAVPDAMAWVQAQRRWLPAWLMRAVERRRVRQAIASSRFAGTAVVSDLGEIDLEDYRSAAGRPQAVWSIPPGGPATAAFLGITRDAEHTWVSAVLPRGLASGGRLERLLDVIERRFTR